MNVVVVSYSGTEAVEVGGLWSSKVLESLMTVTSSGWSGVASTLPALSYAFE